MFETTGAYYLSHEEVVLEVQATFGEPFVYYNDAGNLAIARNVLAAFKAITPHLVWDPQERAWRAREASDDPGKRRVE
jgi:hypothetical protein